MDYSQIEVVFVYNGEFFREKELDGVRRLFSLFGDSEEIDAKKLEEIVASQRVISRFIERGILVKEKGKYRIQDEKIQETIEDFFNSQAENFY
ncbi:MAG: hypothetical protein AABW58_04810 [Nanoarchaeota archaeon]|mgnify:CR=1 FL=1